MGLMPHPERIVDAANSPDFTRGQGYAGGLLMFKTAVEYVQSQQTVNA